MVAWCAIQSALSADLPPDLDAYIERGMRDWKLPGMAIAVVKDGQPILVKGYGVREVGKPEKVDENTVFAIGSATKAFTATALGMLVDRGALEWNTRVHEIDPELEFSDPWVTNEIRISDLPSNHSGLSAISESLWYGSGLPRQEIVDRLKFVPFDEGFRYQYQYRNVMFLLAGEMIPKVADGETWDDFLAEEIFAPLGMKRTLPTEKGLADLENVARPHLIDYEGDPISRSYRSMHNIGPAGSIFSCANDLVPWLKVHLGQNESTPLVDPETLRFLHTAQTPMWTINPEGEVRNSPYPLNSYCLGWVTQSYEGQRLVWHNGNIDGMSAYVAMLPDLGLGVAILSNLEDCEFRTAVFYHIADHFIGIEGDDRAPQLLEKFRASIAARDKAETHWEELAKADLAGELPLSGYVGEYKNPVMGNIMVKDQDGHLVYGRTREQTLDLVVKTAGGNQFLGRHSDSNEDLRTGKVDVEFDLSAGKVTKMRDFSEGIPIEFEKIR